MSAARRRLAQNDPPTAKPPTAKVPRATNIRSEPPPDDFRLGPVPDGSATRLCDGSLIGEEEVCDGDGLDEADVAVVLAAFEALGEDEEADADADEDRDEGEDAEPC